MRFPLHADHAAGGGWSVSILNHDTGDSLLAQPRTLRELRSGQDVFPLPPEPGGDGWPDNFAEDDLPLMFNGVMSEESATDRGVERFGRYLFATLLGQEAWQAILTAAPDDEPLELALTWGDDRALDRLPWEVMYAPNGGAVPPATSGLLALQPGLRFTRRVPGTTGKAYQLTELPSPPRVLVVVGSTLSDTNIRAGAEYLGLLRALKDENQTLNTRLVVEATADQVKRAVDAFKPTVVHVIAHGVPGPKVRLRREAPDVGVDEI